MKTQLFSLVSVVEDLMPLIGHNTHSWHILGFDSFLNFTTILFTNKPNGPYHWSLFHFCEAWSNSFYYPLGGTLVHHKLFMSIKFHATHLHTWVHKGTVQ